jgi:hypothetical protein
MQDNAIKHEQELWEPYEEPEFPEELEVEEQTGRKKKKGKSFEELVAAFRAKVNMIPEECRPAIPWWFLHRQVQRRRIAIDNQIRQFEAGNRVFWSEGLPEEIARGKLASGLCVADIIHNEFLLSRAKVDILKELERTLAAEVEKRIGPTVWFKTVAVPAAEGVGIGPLLACDFLWAIASAKRFTSFGKLVKYAGLDVQNGKAPKRQRGKRITWNPFLRTVLFKLTEVWNRMPECVWRTRWDAWKEWYQEHRPQIVGTKGWKGHIHNMARRKIQREFLRNLYHLWLEYEG